MALVTAALWLFPLALALAACGGPAAPTPPAAARESTPGVAPKDKRPVIAAFGDSLTEGLGMDAGQTYPDHLQKALDRRGYAYRVVNLGVSGDTSTNGVARVEGVAALKPAFVILELGANDGLRGLPVSVTRANLEKIVVRLQKGGANVLLAGMTLPPNYGPAYIRPFEAMYRELAAQYRTPLIGFLLDGVAGNPRLMQRDGLHPNAAGYPRVAENVLRVLEPLLRVRQSRP